MFDLLRKNKEFKFVCTECGEEHIGAPSFSYKYPAQYFDVPVEFLESHVIVDTDFCQIKPYPNGLLEEDVYFIRVVLEIPIHGSEAPFTWGVWVSQSKDNFERCLDLFREDGTEFESFGWLVANLPTYETRNVDEYLESFPCTVQGREIGLRPLLYLNEDNNQMYHDQVNGITWKQAIEIAKKAMHP